MPLLLFSLKEPSSIPSLPLTSQILLFGCFLKAQADFFPLSVWSTLGLDVKMASKVILLFSLSFSFLCFSHFRMNS